MDDKVVPLDLVYDLTILSSVTRFGLFRKGLTTNFQTKLAWQPFGAMLKPSPF